MSEPRVGVRRLNDAADRDTSLAGAGQLVDREWVLVGEPLARVFVEGEPSSAWVVEISYPVTDAPDGLEVIPVAEWTRGTYRDEQPPDRLGRTARARTDQPRPAPWVALRLRKPSTIPQPLLPPPPAGEGFPCKLINFPFC